MEKRYKVLLVDNNDQGDSVAQTVTNLIDELDGRIVIAKDGKEASFKFNNEPFDLVITDFVLPKIDGLHMFENFRKQRAEIPFLFVSAKADDFKEQVELHHKVDWMNRPIDADIFKSKVKKLFRTTLESKENPPHEIILQADERLFAEGEDHDGIFIIKSGRLKVVKSVDGKDILICHLQAGEIVGELSPLQKSRRSASVIGAEESVLIKVPQEKIEETVRSLPKWTKIMMQTIISRLADTTKSLAEAKQEIEKLRKK